MFKKAPVALLAALAVLPLVPLAARAGSLIDAGAHAPPAAAIRVAAGSMLYSTDGQQLAPVYRVNADGSVQFIMDGRLLTVPATLLSDVDGKLISSQARDDLLH